MRGEKKIVFGDLKSHNLFCFGFVDWARAGSIEVSKSKTNSTSTDGLVVTFPSFQF